VNPGLKALLEVSQLGGRPLSAGEVGFRIAPRINAAGRMDVASEIVELFSVKDPARAREIALHLDRLNTERQEEERKILLAIYARIEDEPALRDAYCMVIDGEGWHRGVIGITATRIVEHYGRPTLVVSRDGEIAHGSGRSIAPFHLLNALESCSALFSRYGGHSHAVGFSLPSANVVELREKLDGFARAKLTLLDFEPSLFYDTDLPLAQVTPEFFLLLKRMEPFGVGNPEPVFAARDVRLSAPPRIIKDKHVRFRVSAGKPVAIQSGSGPNSRDANSEWRNSLSFNAMGWRMAERLQPNPLIAGDALDIAFTLSQNEHPDFGGLELSLRDFKPQVLALQKSSSR
jgi:single-stranded-DNA-specific exonuclease